jgi:hypothetical protein
MTFFARKLSISRKIIQLFPEKLSIDKSINDASTQRGYSHEWYIPLINEGVAKMISVETRDFGAR